MPMDRAPLKAALKALVDSLGPDEAIGMKRSLAYLKKQPAYAAVDVAAESALVKELLLEIQAEDDSSSSSSSGSGSTSSSGSGSGSGSDDDSDDTSDVAYAGGSDSESGSGSGSGDDEGEGEGDDDESEGAEAEEGSAGGKRKAEDEAEGAPSKKKAKKAKKEDKEIGSTLKFLDSIGLTSMAPLGERRSAQQAMQRIKGADKPKPKVTRRPGDESSSEDAAI